MNYQWRPPTSRTALRDSIPTQPSAPVRNRFENALPSGTVASRVHYLESRAASSSSQPAPSTSRRREHSRAGFGRRIINRTVSRNGKPNEQPQVTMAHSFLGHHTAQKNLDEEHPISSRTGTCDPSSGLQSWIQPRGFVGRAQCDVASPWCSTDKNTSLTSSTGKYSGHEMDVLQEVDSSGNRSLFWAQTSVFPSLGHADAENPDAYRRDGTVQSDTSAFTTSTVRRQSVRDLYNEYGIARPPGLVPDKQVFKGRDDAVGLDRPRKRCHICKLHGRSFAKLCLNCDHRFCIRCDESLPLLSTGNEAKFSSEANMHEGQEPSSLDAPAKEGNVTQQATGHNTPLWSERTTFQKPSEDLEQIRKLLSFTAKFASRHTEHLTSLQNSRTTPRGINLPEQPTPLLSWPKTTTSVKDSPFLIADIRAAGRSPKLFPLGSSTKSKPCPSLHNPCSKPRQTHGNNHSSSLSSNYECDRPDCRAAHDGHQSYQHSMSCTRSPRRLPPGTDNGYVADISLVDDAALSHSHIHPLTASSQTHSGFSPALFPGSTPPPSLNLCPSEKDDLSEYIECHGYPRTGHTRHESKRDSIPAVITGQCQHCIGDCQCVACQSTHHTVRCCTHTDHRAIAHHHHRRRGGRVSAPATPLECPQLPHNSPDASGRTNVGPPGSAPLTRSWRMGGVPLLQGGKLAIERSGAGLLGGRGSKAVALKEASEGPIPTPTPTPTPLPPLWMLSGGPRTRIEPAGSDHLVVLEEGLLPAAAGDGSGPGCSGGGERIGGDDHQSTRCVHASCDVSGCGFRHDGAGAWAGAGTGDEKNGLRGGCFVRCRDRDCVWRDRFFLTGKGGKERERELEKGDMPLRGGITIVIHLQGREDLIFQG